MLKPSLIAPALLAGALLTGALLAIVPAAAQDRGGVPRRDSAALLNQIDANRGCPQSVTSVTVGVNKTFAGGSSSQQRRSSSNNAGANGCQPLVSTQVVTGANLALGNKTNADQTLTSQGPRGVVSNHTYTRGYNQGYGNNSTATQRLSNQLGR